MAYTKISLFGSNKLVRDNFETRTPKNNC